MKKVLFITCNDINDKTNGGSKCSKRNYEILRQKCVVELIYVRKVSSMESLESALSGYFPPFSKRYFKQIKNKFESEKFDIVFLDGSSMGYVAKYLKEKHHLSTVLFYHNCELDYINVRFNKGEKIKKIVYRHLIYRNEKLSTKYADMLIALSERDAERISLIYKRNVDVIAPMSIEDIYEKRESKEKNCLLLGPSGTANNEGFEWFIKNVSPYINCRTVVVGKQQELNREKWKSDKVDIYGYVDNLAQVYADAAVVAIPLLSGAGMKIKTAEALMFGKFIAGTQEAFSGYGVAIFKNAKQCNDANEFITYINEHLSGDKDNFIEEARELYLKEYSMTATQKIYEEKLDL